MKKLFTTLSALLVAAATMAQVPSYVPTNGLVGYWPFNGNANDESGNGNNGTVNGATLTTDRFGNANAAYDFDGVNENIRISNIQLPSEGISVSIWCYTPVEQASSIFRNNISFSNIINSHIHFNENTNDIYWDYGDISGPGAGRLLIPDATSPSFNQLNEWEHFVFTSSLSESKMEIYRNGVSIASKAEASSQSQTIFDFLIPPQITSRI